MKGTEKPEVDSWGQSKTSVAKHGTGEYLKPLIPEGYSEWEIAINERRFQRIMAERGFEALEVVS